MIGVGINENVILTGIKLNDKDMLEISFDELENVQKPKENVFDNLQTAKVENDGRTGKTVNMFTFKKPSGPKNEAKTEDELIEMVSTDMSTRRTQLSQLMEIFLTTEDINKVWSPYAGTEITSANYRTMFLNDDALKSVWKNYANQTIALLTPFFGDTKYPLRLKLIRQSKEKHFAEIPRNFLKDNPYVELMEVPTPRVKFTPYEIKEGLNDGTPIAKPAGDGSTLPGADVPAEGPNVFGQR